MDLSDILYIATIISGIELTTSQLNLLLHQISFSLRENYQVQEKPQKKEIWFL